MRMCMAFLDHNKRWSMPCRVYHQSRLENRQAENCRQREQCVHGCTLGINRARSGNSYCSVCAMHYPQRKSQTHTHIHIPSRSTRCFIFHSSQMSREVCATNFCSFLSWTLQVNHSIRGLESISVKLIIKEKKNIIRQNDQVIETTTITAHLQQGEESKTKGSFRLAIS